MVRVENDVCKIGAGSVTGCESTSIFYDLRLAQSSRSFVSIENQWRATHGSDQLTAVSCSVAARSGHAAPLPLLPLFLLPVHSHAHHHFSFTCVYRAVVVRKCSFAADETRFFYLHVQHCQSSRRDAINHCIHRYLSVVVSHSYI